MNEISQARTKNYFKQIKVSGFYKLVTILASFIAMPIMIKYLGMEMFGIWATMLTLISWVMLFDFGIGNGLKNKVSESLAQDNPELAASFISTAYGIIGVVSLVFFLVLLVASFWLPWQIIFNTQAVTEIALREAILTLGFFIFFNFWISLANQIYHGLQKTSVVVLGQLISNVLALVFVYALYLFTVRTIVYIVWAYGISLVTANLALTLFLFNQHAHLKPKFTLFSNQKIKPLMTLGLKFFVIQFAVLMMFLTDKILIIQLLGPTEVTSYEVVFKLFSVFTVLHSLIVMPLWPAYSDAYKRKDFNWIRNQLKKQLLIAICLFFGAGILAIIGPWVVKFWMGDTVKIKGILYFLFFIFIIFSVWVNVFAIFISGTGFLYFSVCVNIFIAVTNVPLSIFLVNYVFHGIEGVIIATLCSMSLGLFFAPYQVKMILNNKEGIWMR
ncbi:MAG: oligosaccharide flippase family protein [Methylococcaceae bacterium]|nr:oligosaccharide flippase family protein [Methylococcaceae bacterium]